MITKEEITEARNKILMKFDKASTYRPLDEDSARNIVSSILDSLIKDSNREENITNEEQISKKVS
jgi:transcriptional regulator NrdR family protein|tara:strand:+ start:2179 stop:2373 length:195 start_codon:yes stop_codon:yes gene_type:complete